jgi:hypothetical protein
MYGYVSFQSLKQAIRGKDEAELGQMSHVASLHRFFEAAFNLWQKKTSGGFLSILQQYAICGDERS